MFSAQQAQDALADLSREAAHRGSCFAVLKGPRGSGKSTIIKSLRTRLASQSMQLVTASRWESALPGAALGPLLQRTQAASAGELAEALLEYLRAGCQRPRVLVIENAQWVDDLSFQALHYAWRRLQQEPVLIVVVLRDQDLARLSLDAREFLADTQLHLLQLAAPEPSAVREIVGARTGIDLPPTAAEQLVKYTRGNLQAMIELARENPEQSWEQFTRWPPAPRALSLHVKQLLEGLDPRARAVAEAAAVLGLRARISNIAELLCDEELLLPIVQVVDSSLAQTHGHSGKVRLGFADELTQMAVYHQIPLSTRIQLHARAANIVEDQGAKLGHRADASILPDGHLAQELKDYAQSQGQRGEWSSAATAYFRAMHLSPDAAQRDALLLSAIDAIVAAGELPRAQTYSHKLSSLESSPERDVLSGYISILQGRANTAHRWLSSAWTNAVKEQSSNAMAVISQRRVIDSLCQLKGQRIIDWAEQSLQLAQVGSPLAIENAAIQGLGLAMMGRADEGEQVLMGLLADLPAGAQRQRAEMSLGWVYLATDRVELARPELAAASSTDFSDGSLRIALWARAWLARAEFHMGDWCQALETVRSAQALQERSEIQILRPLIQLTAVQIHALRGNWELAERHLAKSWSPTGSYPVMELPYRIARAEVARARSNYGEVIRVLEPLLQMDRTQGIDQAGFWTWQDSYAFALIRAERLAEAEAFLKPLLENAIASGHRSASARYLSVHGALLAAHGDIDAARLVFEDAIGLMEGVGMVYLRARIDFTYGQCLRRAGKRAECVAPLTRALTIFTHLDATVYIERCTRELQASGTGISRRDSADWSTLTAQERAVANLVCEGASNRRVAEELFIGTKTVQYHLTKIYSKLSVSNRTELAALSRQEFEI